MQAFTCEKCSEPKALFVEKQRRAMITSVVFFLATVLFLLLLPGEAPWRGVAVFPCLITAVVSITSQVRIQCLACDPRDKASEHRAERR